MVFLCLSQENNDRGIAIYTDASLGITRINDGIGSTGRKFACLTEAGYVVN